MARKPPPSASKVWKLVNVGTAVNIAAYRVSGGRVGGRMGKAPILLLHHVGRKSGKERVTPVLYLDDGSDLVVVGSKGGTDKNPAWFHNLTAMDETTVEVGRDKRRVRPRLAGDEERSGLWPRLDAMYPSFAEYREFAGDREIPIVVLEPAA
jgi:deazaflavin-dependent oxidoreductase (nitroreductase family)